LWFTLVIEPRCARAIPLSLFLYFLYQVLSEKPFAKGGARVCYKVIQAPVHFCCGCGSCIATAPRLSLTRLDETGREGGREVYLQS